MATTLRPQEPLYSARFTRDGSRLLLLEFEESYCILNTHTGCKEVTLQEVTPTAYSRVPEFLPGEDIVIGVSNDAVQLWSAHTGSKIADIQVPPPTPETSEDLNSWERLDEIRNVWPSSDGSVLLIAFSSKRAGFWDPKTGEQIAWLNDGQPFKHPSHWPRFAIGNRFLAGLTSDNRVKVYEMGRNPQPLASSTPLRAKCIDLTFAPDDHQILIAEEGRDLRIWNWRNGKEVEIQGRSRSRRATFSPDSQFLAIPGDGFVFRMWNTTYGYLMAAKESESEHPTLNGTDYAHGVHFLPGGQRMLTVTFYGDKHLRLWEVPSGNFAGELRIGHALTQHISFGHGRICVSTVHDLHEEAGRTAIFDTRYGKRMTVVGGEDYVSAVIDFSPDSNRILTQTPEGEAHIWTRRRPESKHGYMELPEFWLTATLAPALLWSVFRDSRSSKWSPKHKRPPLPAWKRRELIMRAKANHRQREARLAAPQSPAPPRIPPRA